jgi:hypothetical protein
MLPCGTLACDHLVHTPHDIIGPTGELLEEALELEMRLEARARAKQASKQKVGTTDEQDSKGRF